MNAARGFTPNQPVVAAWGMGLDSTALIIEWVARSLPLSVVLTADTGVEREETYAYLPIFQKCLWRIDNLIWRLRLQAASGDRREPLISFAESVLDSPVASENR